MSIFLDTGNFRSWTKVQCVKWVEEKGVMDKEDLEMFAKMKCRGDNFDSLTVSNLKEDGLPPGPARTLHAAIQELIRSKNERTYNISLSHAVALFFYSCFCLFVVACCFFFFYPELLWIT